jgi:hypothetical protein
MIASISFIAKGMRFKKNCSRMAHRSPIDFCHLRGRESVGRSQTETATSPGLRHSAYINPEADALLLIKVPRRVSNESSNKTMKEWDIFISHASEDKQSAALPLTLELQRQGARVWLDKFVLKIGDSIREKVDEGLANSRYGVVILSPHFFEKKWPKAELDGLFARNVVLPVWFGVTEKDLLRVSPILAGRLAGNMADGVSSVAQQLIDKLFSIADSHEKEVGFCREFAALLAEGSLEEVREFLRTHSWILATAFGLDKGDYLRHDTMLGGVLIHFSTARFQQTTGRYDDWNLTFLGDPNDPFFKGEEKTAHLGELLADAEKLRSWVGSNIQAAREILPGLKNSFFQTIVSGRRPQPDSLAIKRLGDLNDLLLGVQVRTYDWLLDKAINS